MAELVKDLTQFRFILEDKRIIIYDKENRQRVVFDEIRHDSFLRFSISAKRKLKLSSNRGIRLAFWKRIVQKNDLVNKLRQTIKNLRTGQRKHKEVERKI